MKAVIVLALLALSVSSQSCDNPMASFVNMTSNLLPSASSTVSGLKYCKSLQSGNSTCCDSDGVADVEKKVKALTSFLTEFAANRDTIVADAFGAVFNNLTSLETEAFDLLDKIVPQLSLSDDQKDDYKLAKKLVSQVLDELKGNLSNAASQFATFQKNRAQCFQTLLDIQASAYCLACDPDWAKHGVNEDGSINYSDDLCKRLQKDCYGYISSQQATNQLWLLVSMAQELPPVVQSMDMIKAMIDNTPNFNIDNLPNINIDQAEIDEFFSEFDAMKDTVLENFNLSVIIDQIQQENNSGNTTMHIGTLPDGCNSETDCSWICSHFLQNGAIHLIAVVAGGDVSVSSSSDFNDDQEFRILLERILDDSNTWNPTEGDSGVTITVQADPANQQLKIGSGSRILASFSVIALSLVALIFA